MAACCKPFFNTDFVRKKIDLITRRKVNKFSQAVMQKITPSDIGIGLSTFDPHYNIRFLLSHVQVTSRHVGTVYIMRVANYKAKSCLN